MNNEELISYIRKQLQNNFDREAIIKVLLDNRYKQDQIDQAFTSVLANSNHKTLHSGRKIIAFSLIFLFIGIGAIIFFITSQSSKKSSSDEVLDCGTYHDIGYMKGLYGKDINDNSGSNIQILKECKNEHDTAYEEGKKSANDQKKAAFESTRRSDVIKIADALYNYSSANNGKLPMGITDVGKEIGTAGGKLNIISELIPYTGTPFPVDPMNGTIENTGYQVLISAKGGVMVVANINDSSGHLIFATR